MILERDCRLRFGILYVRGRDEYVAENEILELPAMNPFLQFDLLLPKRIVFGWGKRAQLGSLAATLGHRAFLIGGSRALQTSPVWTELLDSLRQAGVEPRPIASGRGEPTIEDVDQAARGVQDLEPGAGDFVLGVGGGSALDLAKAVSAMVTNARGASVREFLEGIGTGRKLNAAPLPLLALPTTAGTGSEATKNAVISCSVPPCKKSLRSDQIVPAVVLIDPELTVTCPPRQTACSGMDAIAQLVESYLSRRSQSATDVLCLTSLPRAIRQIVRAVEHPADREARETMSWAALASGVALANSGLGMAHGVAAALGAICDVPHGLACAVLLPIAMRANREAAHDKLKNIGMAVCGQKALAGDDAVSAAISTIEGLLESLQIPKRLRDLGVQREQIPALVAGSRGNSMNGNPREISDAELTEILEVNW